jgi:hypothetical protein
MNRELTPKASEEHHCSNRTQEVIVYEIMPTPEKKKYIGIEKLEYSWSLGSV